jgi:hypothetical protein
MSNRWLTAAFLLCALTGPAGCGGPANPAEPTQTPLPPAPVPIPLSTALDMPADVRFRFVARQVQESLLMESCPPRPTLRRAVVLAPEIAAARAFEAGLPGPARFHWQVVIGDIAHRRAAGRFGCWSDSTPTFARAHIQMARDGVRLGLRELRTLAPTLPPLPDGAAAPPPNAAAFRERAGRLAELLDPLCGGQESGAVLAPARAELAGLRRRLAGTPYALQLELGFADALHGRGVPECAEIAPVPPEVASRNALLEARRRIGLIEALIRR